MSVLWIALPAALCLASAAVLAFVWAVKTGQLDDLDTPPVRALFDDVPRDRSVKRTSASASTSPLVAVAIPIEQDARFAPMRFQRKNGEPTAKQLTDSELTSNDTRE
jgi:cbb3-type cytochrome oxidase maturation protein